MLRALELVWLTVALVSIFIGIYISITRGLGESYIFFIFTLVGGLMYYIRKKQRIAYDKQKNQQGEK